MCRVIEEAESKDSLMPVELRMMLEQQQQQSDTTASSSSSTTMGPPEKRSRSDVSSGGGGGGGRGAGGRGRGGQLTSGRGSAVAVTMAVTMASQSTAVHAAREESMNFGLRQNTLWTIGWDQYYRDHRHDVCVAMVNDRMELMASNIVKVMLAASRPQESGARA